jgi:hypothetical protein
MKSSTKYLILIILNALLIIGWPICLWLVSPVNTLTAFLVGAAWASDIADLFQNICYYMEAKIEEM